MIDRKVSGFWHTTEPTKDFIVHGSLSGAPGYEKAHHWSAGQAVKIFTVRREFAKAVLIAIRVKINETPSLVEKLVCDKVYYDFVKNLSISLDCDPSLINGEMVTLETHVCLQRLIKHMNASYREFGFNLPFWPK